MRVGFLFVILKANHRKKPNYSIKRKVRAIMSKLRIINVIWFVCILMFSASCEHSINEININEDESLKEVSVYNDLDSTNFYFFEDKEGLKQGAFRKQNDLGQIIETGYYLDDTLVGFCSYYDTMQTLLEKKSYLLLDDKYYVSEFYSFEDSIDAQVWVIGNFFETKLLDNKLVFNSQFPSYDSLVVNMYSYNAEGKYTFESTKTVFSERFDVDVSLVSERVKKMKIIFEIHTEIEDKKRMVREIERVYPVKNGEVETLLWEIKGY